MKLTQPLARQARQALQSRFENTPISNGGHRCIDSSLYGHIIDRCTDRRLFRQGEQIHARLLLLSATANTFLASKLIGFYSRTHQLSTARNVFDQIPKKNTFTFNALLITYSVHSLHTETLELFRKCLSRRDDFLDSRDVKPDTHTLSCVVKSVSEVAVDGSLSARIIHCCVIKYGLDFDLVVGNGLMTCYSRCGDLVSARAFFDNMCERDLVSWTSMISGYSECGSYEECKNLYRAMLDLEDLKPNGVTVVSVMHASAQSADLIFGMAVHQFVIDSKIEMTLSVCNSLLAFYAKCGHLYYATQLFKELPQNDIVCSTIVSAYMLHGFVDEAVEIFGEMQNPGLRTWTAVISGKVQNNQYYKVLDLVRQMQVCGIKPNCVTLSSVLPAIPYVSHLEGAKEIHAYAIKIKSNWNIYVASALIDTYAKLGFLSGAQRIFDQTDKRNVVVWTVVIAAYASHGDAKVTLCLFDEMLNSRIKPNALTFTYVLAACSRTGLVDEAWEIFHETMPKCGIHPSDNHFCSMVACLCRARKLSKAVDFVMNLSIVPTAPVWGALLAGASECGDIELAKFVSDHLIELDPKNPSYYVSMANLYAKVGRWKEAERTRDKMTNSGLKKIPGSSRIEASG